MTRIVRIDQRAHHLIAFVATECAAQGVSMVELAERSGYSKVDVWRWTSGKSRPSVWVCENLLGAIGYTMAPRKLFPQE